MKKVIIYGAGNRLRQSIVALDYTYDIVSIVDMDPKNKGIFLSLLIIRVKKKSIL